jgi:hypothetical protein
MKFMHIALATLVLTSLNLFAKDPEITRRQEDDQAKNFERNYNRVGLQHFWEDESVEDYKIPSSTKVVAEDKNSFKRRASPYTSIHTLAMSIETNFPVPFIGSQNYFGKIYLLTNDVTKIDYRDEQIAHKYYKEELKKPKDFYTQGYKVSSINSKSGLDLVNAAGAVVNLKSGNFSPVKGGRLYLKVKAPKTEEMNITMEVVVNDRSVQNYVVVGTQKYPFTSFTINADKSFISGTSILNGILSVEFNQNGRFSYSIKP